ncbi:MAG: nucleoside monophosphate kinase, partial [Candidatus Omnitrophica bacterium]|nr:nucleoside monophosphate kinase [Candidatus Omnitrophota bacterium]
ERLRQPDTKNGFVLDGYPRNIHQADELESALMKDSHTIDKVINLEADQEIIIQRLAGRRLCSGCQANYHIKNMPPKKEGICDHCQGKLYQRIDDNEKTIKNRLKIYKDQTLSLIDYYSEGNKLLRVTANEEAQVVLKIILEQLNDYNKIPARD